MCNRKTAERYGTESKNPYQPSEEGINIMQTVSRNLSKKDIKKQNGIERWHPNINENKKKDYEQQ